MTNNLATKNNIRNLPLMELFHTLQGEGFHTGKPAVFIRLGGCDVGCVWCDVKESWEATAHPMVSIENIVKSVKEFKTNFVVITGGEPTMHDISKLVDELKNNNFYARSSNDISFSCSFVSMAPGRYCRMKEIGSFTIPSFLHNKAAIRPDLPSPALQCIRMFLSF